MHDVETSQVITTASALYNIQSTSDLLSGSPCGALFDFFSKLPFFFRPGSLQANVRNGGRRAEQVQGNGVDLSTGSDGFLEQQDPAHRT